MNTMGPKKTALKELIKHMNKKRFQDKEVDPKDMMTKAMADNEDDETPQAPPEPPEQDGPDGDDDDFGDYRKGFMRGRKPSPAGHTLAIMIGQPSVEKKAGNPMMKKGRGRG